MMTQKSDIENLVQVKTALAQKYHRLALLTSSRPRKANYHRRAERLRRQAEDARRMEQSG
jgi:hypothetical protein